MSRTGVLSKELAAVLALFPGPVAIRPSKRRQLALLLALLSPAFLSAVMPIWILSDLPAKDLLYIAVVPGMVFVPMGWLIAVSFVRDMPQITLDADGFALWNALGGGCRLHWGDVEGFKSGFGLVKWANASRPRGFWARLKAPLGVFPGIYRLAPEEIARLMAAWRERALNRE